MTECEDEYERSRLIWLLLGVEREILDKEPFLTSATIVIHVDLDTNNTG